MPAIPCIPLSVSSCVIYMNLRNILAKCSAFPAPYEALGNNQEMPGGESPGTSYKLLERSYYWLLCCLLIYHKARKKMRFSNCFPQSTKNNYDKSMADLKKALRHTVALSRMTSGELKFKMHSKLWPKVFKYETYRGDKSRTNFTSSYVHWTVHTAMAE
ncbi:uncharacterized protein ACBT44_013207 isoform 1-T1 [Syngnathus typhle]